MNFLKRNAHVLSLINVFLICKSFCLIILNSYYLYGLAVTLLYTYNNFSSAMCCEPGPCDFQGALRLSRSETRLD